MFEIIKPKLLSKALNANDAVIKQEQSLINLHLKKAQRVAVTFAIKQVVGIKMMPLQDQENLDKKGSCCWLWV